MSGSVEEYRLSMLEGGDDLIYYSIIAQRSVQSAEYKWISVWSHTSDLCTHAVFMQDEKE